MREHQARGCTPRPDGLAMLIEPLGVRCTCGHTRGQHWHRDIVRECSECSECECQLFVAVTPWRDFYDGERYLGLARGTTPATK